MWYETPCNYCNDKWIPIRCPLIVRFSSYQNTINEKLISMFILKESVSHNGAVSFPLKILKAGDDS